MLPFLNRKKDEGIITTQVIDRNAKPEENQIDMHAHLACAADLLKAIHANDVNGMAEALRNMFLVLDSEPHEEGPHLMSPQESRR